MKKRHTAGIAAVGFILASLAAVGYAADFDGAKSQEFSSLKELVSEQAPEVKVGGIKSSRMNEHYEPETDCKTIHLIDKDGTAPSWYAMLSSDYVGTYVETDDYGNSHNYQQVIQSYSARAEFRIGYRELKDGEVEYVELCYNFPRNKPYYKVTSPFVYDVVQRMLPGNAVGYSLELKPIGRVPAAPGAADMELSSFAYDAPSKTFYLTVKNNFPKEQQGNKLQISVELVQDRLFDSSLGKRVYEAVISPDSGAYLVQFKEGDFGAAKEAGDFRGKDRKFFVKWGFSVKGNGTYIDKGRTDSVAVPR